jgi:serine O-acetyltransferase
MHNLSKYFFLRDYPVNDDVVELCKKLIEYMFPRISEIDNIDTIEKNNFENINIAMDSILKFETVIGKENKTSVKQLYIESLKQIRELLITDAEFIVAFDPAAKSIEEVILSYPGFFSIMVHRLAHTLFKLNVDIVPRMMSEWAHGKTGIDIHPGAKIGSPFFIDHGTGVVIGETSIIGNGVKVYQGVTLGAIAVKKEDATNKRHPTIEDNVVLYAGSTILGGNTTIGRDSIIGGNTWITESIEPNSIVYHKSSLNVINKLNKNEPINFVI